MISQIPLAFSRFIPAIEPLMQLGPTAVAFAGTYGNPSKHGDGLSDLDILFVFHTESILNILNEYLGTVQRNDALISLYLGIHPQFGHMVNLYFTDAPLQWVDVGIMDEIFASNYLTGLPIKVLKGRIPTCGIPPNADNQIAHLAKKLAKAQNRKDAHMVSVYSYRYLQWAQIDASRYDSFEKTFEVVFKDISKRFPCIQKELCHNNPIDTYKE